MNLIVCLKQVPGTTKVTIDPQTNTLIRQGIENIINPFDAYALEEGVRLREQHGGKVTALSMGPLQAKKMMRDAISVGADEAVLLSDCAFAGADTWATAYTIAQAIDRLKPYDLVICGRQTIDGDTGQVAPELAAMLDVPFVACVSQVEDINDGVIRVKRMVDEGYEVIETSLPAVISVVKEINVPRLPSLRGLTRAKIATIPVWTVGELGVDESAVGLAGSFTKVIKVFFPQRISQAEMLSGDLENQVATLVNRLKENKLI